MDAGRRLVISGVVVLLLVLGTLLPIPLPAHAAPADPGFTFPWPLGQEWILTGGPHPAFGPGTPLGALDFQPPNSGYYGPQPCPAGIVAAGYPIRPAAPGRVVVAGQSYVEIDHGNGWRTVYYHVGNLRVSPGQLVDRNTDLGNPSCEAGLGGTATGPHVHFAAKYNGAWVPATAFTLAGWQISTSGQPYDGSFQRGSAFRGVWGTLCNDGGDPTITCDGRSRLDQPSARGGARPGAGPCDDGDPATPCGATESKPSAARTEPARDRWIGPAHDARVGDASAVVLAADVQPKATPVKEVRFTARYAGRDWFVVCRRSAPPYRCTADLSAAPIGHIEIGFDVEYADGTVVPIPAGARLIWKTAERAQSVATTGGQAVIVDDGSPGFQLGGPPQYWKRGDVGYHGRMVYTLNNRSIVENWARWTPTLPQAGRYEVFVYIPSNYAGAHARYEVHHAAGVEMVTVYQEIYSDAWVSLGTYPFAAGTAGFVELGDATGQAPGTERIGVDAVKFERRP